MTKAGEILYVSDQLNRVWGFGYASVGDVTFGSAAYVARYNIKKIGSVVDRDHYCNPSSGEVLAPEYVTMSRRPGIGARWIQKYMGDVYPRDSRVIKGVDTKPCKFYDQQYEVSDPAGFREIKLRRMVKASSLRADNTEERLEVKEKVKLAQISQLKTEVI